MEACVNNSDSILISFFSATVYFAARDTLFYFPLGVYRVAFMRASDGAVNYGGERKTFRRVI